MQAATIHEGEEAFRLEELPLPEVGDDDVLVKVEVVGLTRGALSLWRARGRMRIFPHVLGYENAGTIAAVGSAVRNVQPGDRVRVHPVLHCRDCYYCRTDREPMCAAVAVSGGAAYSDAAMPMYERYHNGGLAEYLKAPSWNIDPIADNVPFDAAARVHSTAVAFRAIRLTEPVHGSTLVVNAATGGVGSAAVACASLFGFARIIAVSRSRAGLEGSAGLAPGLVQVVPTEELGDGSLGEAILAANGGKPVDAVVDFMPGSPEVTIAAIMSMRKGATAVLAGGNYGELAFPYGRIMQNGWRIIGSNGYVRRDARELLSLMAAGRLDLQPIVTHRFPLPRVNDAADAIWQRKGAPRFVNVHPQPA